MSSTIIGGNNTGIWIHSASYAPDFSAISLTHTCNLLDTTAMNDASRTRKAGLKSTELTGEGYVDVSDSGQDDRFFNTLVATKRPFTVAPDGASVGDLAYFFDAIQSQYEPGGSIGEMFSFSMSASSVSPLVRGQIEFNSSSVTSTDQSNGVQLGSVSSGETLYAAVHAGIDSGSGTLDVTVESDDNASFTTPTTQITFSQFGGSESGFDSVDGSITDDYWRFVFTVGGSPSFTVVAVFGIL